MLASGWTQELRFTSSRDCSGHISGGPQVLASGLTLLVRSVFTPWLVWTRLRWSPDACIRLDAEAAFRLLTRLRRMIHERSAVDAFLAVPRCLLCFSAVAGVDASSVGP